MLWIPEEISPPAWSYPQPEHLPPKKRTEEPPETWISFGGSWRCWRYIASFWHENHSERKNLKLPKVQSHKVALVDVAFPEAWSVGRLAATSISSSFDLRSPGFDRQDHWAVATIFCIAEACQGDQESTQSSSSRCLKNHEHRDVHENMLMIMLFSFMLIP